ncbi:MAG: sigma-70 family RNA polymerase sigma factor [Candidatus Aminicenantes bacterium]|nr:sigma-70 family RNA polymerase sigma factor [Acidobacteriota bacterium]MCG2809883.1 sigma-70 family RNA polymerase sigma factor [Candidatus Aminicenantes bacterium]
MADAAKQGIAVEQMYHRYAPMVLRRCRRLLQNEELAVDAMQDVFVRLLASRDRLHGRYPSSLLFRMATNVCLNIIRDRKSAKTDSSKDVLNRIACCDEQETKTLSGIILDRLFRREKPSTREMAVLHFVDGMTYREVARETNLSVSGVRKRLRDFRARALKVQEG